MGQGYYYHHDSAQGEFKLCITDLGCVQHKYPKIRKSQYANGSTSASWWPT